MSKQTRSNSFFAGVQHQLSKVWITLSIHFCLFSLSSYLFWNVKSSYALNSHSPPNVVSILFEIFSQFSFLLLIRLEVCCSVFILIVVAREDDEDLVWHHMVHVFLLCLHFVSHSTSIHSLSHTAVKMCWQTNTRNIQINATRLSFSLDGVMMLMLDVYLVLKQDLMFTIVISRFCLILFRFGRRIFNI